MNEQIREGNVLKLWAPKYPEVTQWVSHLQKKEKSAFYLYRFCQWANKTPRTLLEMKKDPASKEAEKLLNAFAVADLKDLQMTNPVQFLTVQQVRSFFKWNMCDLSKIAGQMTLDKVKPYNKLSKEGLRKLWNYAYNPRDKALLTFTCSTAIAKETLSEICWKHLQDDWQAVELPCINLPSELLKGHGRGKYKNVRQITFLTPEAKRDLINYKEWIERNMGRSVTPEDHIFREIYAPYNPESYDCMGYLIWALSQRAGIPFSWHDARRWVNTALEQVGISPNWARKIRGRMVRGEEAPYSQPAIDQLRDKFREAVPLLEFTSETPVLPKDVQEKLAALEAEQIALKRQYGIFRQRARKPKERKPAADCNDGKHCQKIVSEDALPQLLADGWTFVATLPSGKCVVSDET
jgi:hypothetical protein